MRRKLHVFIIFCLCLIGSVNAQLIVSDTLTAEQLADLIDGPGVTILDPQITCPEGAYGRFEANNISNFDPSEGIILATGIIENAIGPNNTESKSTSFPPQGDGDPDLNVLSQFATDDACKFEFDIIPDGDSLRFEFTFASEEYSEYACTNFNDVFGFFISGPGIVGDPGLGGKKNIALIPGTTEPVTINTVNGGNPTTNPPCPPSNGQYFQANPLNPLADLQYDGWTRDLFALATGLQACEKYHLELVIADASDQLWDSGVFIEQIVSNNISIRTETAGGVDFMIEGCNPGCVIFERDNTLTDLEITYFLQGTAMNGTDYGPIGNIDPLVENTITIPAGQDTAKLFINPFDDNITEGLEYIDIYVGNPLCAATILDSLRFFIRDSLEVDIVGETLVCAGDTVELEAISDAVEYDWGPGGQVFFPSDTVPVVSTVVNDDITIFASGKIATCVTTVAHEIEVNTLTIIANVTDSICLGDTSGEIDITVLDSGGGLSYEWTGPDGPLGGNEDLSGLPAGEYCVNVMDADGCTASSCYTIASYSDLEINLSPVEYVGGVNISCNGGSDGMIFAVASEGIQPYTYTWNDPAMTSGEILSGVPAGTYTVIALDAEGCGVTDSVTLIEPDPLQVMVSESNNLCFGDQTGLASATGIGGVEPYSFFWYNAAGVLIDSDSIAENIAAGSYSVAVRDGNLCTDSISFDIVGPTDPIQIELVSQTNVSCAGFSDGSAQFTATGGTVSGPGDYVWSPSQNPTNLAAGQYTITVTDLNGCTEEFPLIITEPLALEMTLEDQQNITCLGEECGSAIVFVEGGTPPYDFLWPDGTITINNLELCDPGTYTPTVTDSLGCVAQLDIEITAVAAELSATFDITNVLCGGDTTGSIDMTILGGTAPFDIVWAGGECDQGPFNDIEDLDDICAGEWCVFITDVNGCSFDTCVVVGENPALNYAFEMTPAECFGAFTGDIDFTVIGGVAPYSFEWYGGAIPPDPIDTSGPPIATTEDLIDQPGAVYLVQVTDDIGCTLEREITITAPDDLDIDTIAISNYNGFEISCPDACDGFIDIDVTGGTTTGAGNYTYEWKEQALGFEDGGLGSAFQDQMGLCASEDTVGYEVIVVDDNMCLLNAFFIMEAPEELEIELVADSVSCSGATDGGATATVSGGVPSSSYNFEWFDDHTLTNNVGSGNPLTGVGEGLYYVQVTDDNGCTAIDSVEIETPNQLIIELFAAEFPGGFNILGCNGEETGFIAAAVSGGTVDYTINWTDPSGATINTTDLQIENLAAGSDYCLEITDEMGCITTACIELTEPFPLDVTAMVTDITCFGESDGIIELTVSGGVDPVVFWGDPGLTDSLTTQTDLEHGIYYVTVVDSSGCQDTFEYTIIEPEVLKTVLDPTLIQGGFNIECAGDMDAEIIVTTTGGTGDYTYDWEHIAGNDDPADQSGLGPGTYIVTTFDDNMCVDMDTVTISEPPPIMLDFFVNDSISCFGECDGQIGVNATGGIMSFVDYQWDFGFNGPITPDTLCIGDYSVTVTDENDCIAMGTFTLTGPAPITPSVNITNISCAEADDGSIDLTILGGTPEFIIHWTLDGDTISMSEDLNDLGPGTYCLNIVDANGCEFDACYDITEPSGMSIDAVLSDYAGFNVSCGSDCDGTIDVTVTGGTGVYTYDWQDLPGNNNVEDRTGLCAGNYTVIVTDMNGCTIQLDVELTQPETLEVMLESPLFPGGTNISCVGDSTGAIISTITGGVEIDTIFWNYNGSSYPQGANLEDISILFAGTYEINVVDVNGCSVTETITLNEPSSALDATVTPFVYPSGDNISCFGLCDGSFTTTISGGSPGYSIEYRDADGNEIDPLNLCAGIYTILVLDTNECFVTLEDTLFQPEPLLLDSAVFGINLCSYDTLASAQVIINGGSPGFNIDWSHIVGDNEADSVGGLGPGTYPVNVTDINGCEAEQMNIEIEGPPPIELDTVVTNVSCFGFSDGAIDVTPSGGTPDFDYQWSIGSSAITEDINSLAAGIYQLNVTDMNGCLDSILVEVTEPDTLAIAISNLEEALCGESNGSIDLSVSGGTLNYTYDWGCDGVIEGSPDLSNAFAGDTTLCVTDANNCMASITINVPGIEGAMALDVIREDVSCAGAEDGCITVVVVNGSPTFDFDWAGSTETSNVLCDIPGGSYDVTVTDENNCTVNQTIVVIEPDSLEIELSPLFYANGTNLSALGECDGAIEGFTSGGTEEYSYQWTGVPQMVPMGQDTLESPAGLCEGDYCVEITDENGCVTEACTRVDGPDEIIIPGGVSPNGDGANDGLVIIGLDAYPDNSIQIFNRWGNIVYERNGYNNGDPWVGQSDSGDEILPDGTYFIVLLIPDANLEFNEYVELRR